MRVLFLFLISVPLWSGETYPWKIAEGTKTLAETIAPPQGFRRMPEEAVGFSSWLRGLPMRKDDTVYLYNGDRKTRQDVQIAVFDIDPGGRDLQQCADAVMRLRAEYLFGRKWDDRISFNFTSGDPAHWREWRLGMRPKIAGNRVNWSKQAEEDGSYANFRRYLNTVFAYAGTASLVRQLQPVPDPRRVRAGDVFIQGGFPGHAVMVVDVAENEKGACVFLLAQSYMPAQDIHILRRPGSDSPWYEARSEGVLDTPEWRFSYTDLYRW